MASYVAKLVYDGESAAISFCSNFSYTELCDNIRNQFPVLVGKSLQLKFTLPPDSIIYRLRNDVDMSMMHMVLVQMKSSWIDINVSTQAEATTVDKQIPAQTPAEFSFSGDDANQYLGCFRREEAKSYMSSAWKNYITHKGQMFERGAIDFRLKLRMYAIEVGFEYNYAINKKDRVTAVCKKRDTEGCNWCVKASLNRYLSSLD